MHTGTHSYRRVSLILGVLGLSALLPLAHTWSAEMSEQPQADRREGIFLGDTVLRAGQNNIDISISRQTKKNRFTATDFLQTKFDPLFRLNGEYKQSGSPFNPPSPRVL